MVSICFLTHFEQFYMNTFFLSEVSFLCYRAKKVQNFQISMMFRHCKQHPNDIFSCILYFLIIMLFTVVEHHRNSDFLHLFGPITQKRDFGQKKCIHVKLFKKGQKTYRNHKKYFFFISCIYFFALLSNYNYVYFCNFS